MNAQTRSILIGAGRVTVIYAIVGALWIFFSDSALELYFKDAESLSMAQTYKGWAYIAATAGLLFLLIHRELTRYTMLRDKARREEEKLSAQILDSEQALHASERKFRAIFEAAPVGVVTVRSDRTIGIGNPAMAKMLGYKVGELEGKHIREITHPDDLEEDGRLYAELAAGKRTQYSMEKRYMRSDGGFVPTFLTVASIRGNEGKYLFAVGIAQDITELKQRQEEIRQLNEDLEQKVEDRTWQLQLANRELEAFSYSVSHDLRAPLDAIEGFGKAVLEDHGPKIGSKGLDYLNRILSSTTHMRRLIDDLLLLSRTSRQQMDMCETDLSSIARGVFEELRRRDSTRDVQCLVQGGLVGRADPGLMRVLLENLIGNAWKFTTKSGETRIEFGRCDSLPDGLENPSGVCAYFVADNGVGFDMDLSDRLFTPFQRLHREADFPGTGIGLATAQRVVTRHGGEIIARSKPGEGATFYFTLPDGRS
ncbi:PAS domain S-box protein [bacterium]|nr:PAS domain S-box protein [bacterium]